MAEMNDNHALHTGAVEPALAHYLRAAAAQPFDWRGHHCGRFAGGWVALRRGADPGVAFWPRFSSPAGFARVLRRETCGSLLALARRVAATIDIGEIAPASIASGDIAVIEVETPSGRAQALAIASGRFFASLRGGRGLVMARRDSCRVLAAWRV